MSFAQRVAAAVAAINQAKTLLGVDTVYSSKQMKHALKFKRGGEQFVPTLAELSARYGVEVPSRPTADMTAAMAKATEIEPARTAIAELAKIVDDSYFGARSATWSTATSLYSMLRKGSSSEPKLASALSPLEDFFANRHPSVAAEHPKRSTAKAADKQQKKVATKIAKLQSQIAQLQAVSITPGAAPAASAEASSSEAAAPVASPAVAAPVNGTPTHSWGKFQ